MPFEIETCSAVGEKDLEFGNTPEKKSEVGKPFLGRLDIAGNGIKSFRRAPYKQNFKL